MEIGYRLKQIRKERNLSLRALAELCEVTVGALSQIENDNSSPSVSTLKRILKALGLSMADFFAAVEPTMDNGARLVFPRDRQIEVSPSEGLSLLGLPRTDPPRAIQILVETYEPGATTGDEFYSHDGEECGVCLEGEVELSVSGKKTVLKPGDLYYFESAKPHRFANRTSAPARIISACTPGTF